MCKMKLKLQILELEKDNFHIMLKGKFQDGEVCNWIVDTGASKSVLDKNLVDYYNEIEAENENEFQSAGINEGMVETLVGEAFPFWFGSLQIEKMKVALIDLSHVNDIYSKYTDLKIAGLLGGDILKKYNAVIDYRRSKIIFNTDK